MWIVPAPSYAMHNISNGRYLLGNGASEDICLVRKLQNNVVFNQTRSSDRCLEIEIHPVLATSAIRNVDYNNELYVDDGIAYNFSVR